MKKKTIYTALTAALSTVMVCGTLITPALAAENNTIVGEMTNGNDISTIETITTTIPSSLKNGKEIANVLTKDEALDKYKVDLEKNHVMILYTDNSYDVVKVAECMTYSLAPSVYKEQNITQIVHTIDSVHEGWYEPRQTIEISIYFPNFEGMDIYWDDNGYIGNDTINESFSVNERTYKIYKDGELICTTNDPEIVKGYGFIGKQNEFGHYVNWIYSEDSDVNIDEIPELNDKPQQELFNYPTKPAGSVFVKKGAYDICITSKGYGWNGATFINGIIVESGDLNKEPENPDTPENPEQPENPDTPENPEQPENPDTPENPEQPENPDTPENPEQPENPDTPENPEQPENPDTPENPEQPENPDTPENPEQPENPDTPEEPEQPKEPIITITTLGSHSKSAKEEIELTIEF